MRITQFFLKEMGDHIGKCIANYDGDDIPQGILFVDDATSPLPDYVCIASRADLVRFVGDPAQLNGAYLFVPADSEDAEELPLFENASYFETDLGHIQLYNLLNSTLDKLGSSARSRIAGKGDFADFIHDVASMHLTRANEIVSRLRGFPNVNDMPFRVMVFEFDDPKTQTVVQNNFIAGMQATFVNSNAAIYFNRIVAVVQATTVEEDAVRMPERQVKALEALCERYRCCGCVGNMTRNFAMMRTQYILANSTLDIGKRMRERPEKRVFFVEENYMYLLLDSYYHEFERIHHHDSYIYMLHPGVGALIRYDNAHKSDLRKLAYVYLLNERNITKTAQAMVMHRNTVIYKVKKIVEIIEDDLEDPMIRERILVSCMMCDYFERALGVPPNSFPGYLG